MEENVEDFDNLFEEAYKSATKTHETLGEKIVSKAEIEFCGYSEEEKLRQLEVKELTERMIYLKNMLSKCGNIKNPKMTEANAKRSKKRKEYKKNIAIIQNRLQEIEEERKGATLSTKDMASGMRN